MIATMSLLGLLAAPPGVVARMNWWVEVEAQHPLDLTVVATARKEVKTLTVTRLQVLRGRDVVYEQDDVGYFRGVYPSRNQLVTVWVTGSSGKVLVLTYQNGKVQVTLEAFTKWLPDIVHERGGNDLVLIVPDDSTAKRRAPPGGPPLTATVYRFANGRFTAADSPWAKRFEGLKP